MQQIQGSTPPSLSGRETWYFVTTSQDREVGMADIAWFASGFAVAMLVGMITTTTPAKAAVNLAAWKSLFVK
jgi:hypothetical protein